MESVWSLYGLGGEFVWNCYEVLVWSLYGLGMDLVWSWYAPGVELVWNSDGVCM